jgi:hypothetical protein
MYVKTGFGSKSIFSFLDILAFENQRRWSQHLSLGHHFTSISKENFEFYIIINENKPVIYNFKKIKIDIKWRDVNLMTIFNFFW